MYGFDYNDKISFLGKDVKPYWKVIGFNKLNQMFVSPISNETIKWSIDYIVINVEKTPIFIVKKRDESYSD